ncbi:TonB-dependent siderophore receptor [Maricaulis maris]|uniref:Iron complex outermembrane receptor protein n=1 Tax=Maricaulis maris TaxID=74318 RepID=A0A495DD25_9PROT|nr:TonB-dependent siderophore receptor [Maricaulis maris]RKR00190.1 iron complex outermembrane receptor protein [Maricaulis maris]
MLRFNTLRRPAPIAFACLASTALTGLAAPSSVLAQDADETEDVVVVHGVLGRYSATKSDTPVIETPRSVSIETLDQILDRGGVDLSDAYLYSAGVIGDTYGISTRVDSVQVRGLRAPEYRDSLQALFGSYNNTRSDIYTIEQVEILRGPSAILYGQGSPGGIVNVVSKTPEDEFSGEIVGEVGNHDRYQLAADFTGPLDADGTWLYRGIGVWRETGTQIDHIDEEAITLAPSLTFAPGPDTRLSAIVTYQDINAAAASQFLPIHGTLLPGPDGRHFDANVFTGEPDFDRYDTESVSLTLLAEHRVNANLQLEATVRRTESEADYRQAWISFIGGDRHIRNPDGSLYRDGYMPRTFYASQASSEQTAADMRARLDFETGAFSHKVLGGLQYQDVTTDNDSAYLFAIGLDFATGLPDAPYGDSFWFNPYAPSYGAYPSDAIIDAYMSDSPESRTQSTGLYLHDQIEHGSWLATVGLRSDWVETDTGSATQDDDKLSTSFALMYRFDIGLNPYVSYAESFEPVIGTAFDGSAYEPQEGRQYEIGVKYQPPGSRSLVTLSWFDIEQSNLLTADPAHPGFQIQAGVVTITGFEVEAAWYWDTVSLDVSASQLETETLDGYQLASIPEVQASAWLGWQPTGAWSGFRAGAGVRHVGESQNGTDSLETPSYTLVDAMIGYEMDAWNFGLHASNLFDEAYFATCLSRGDCFVGEDRTVVARAARRF